MTNHVIYVPGLGDQHPQIQLKLLKIWRWLGLNVHFQNIGWADGEAFEPKLERILESIDEINDKDTKISLVGVSAGASAALNAYSLRKDKITRVVFICGKLLHPETVNPRYFIENPAFRDSLYLAQENIKKLNQKDKSKMLTAHPLYDNLVPVGHTKIPGIRKKLILAVGHILSIFVALVFYAPGFAKFIKAKDKK